MMNSHSHVLFDRAGRLAAAAVCAFLLLSPVCVPVAAQARRQVIAPGGARYELAGTDATRGNDQLIQYTPGYYRKSPPGAAGLDVYVVGGKVVEARDRAQAVYVERKPDPGSIDVGAGGFVLSGHGAARKWLLANLKVGDAVQLGEATAAAAAKPGGEVPPAAELPCFPGAYYRKAVSSFDAWTGIVGVVKLGEPKTDPDRLDANDKQPLDNFSVYMGGRAGEQEVDAGLTWEFTRDEAGNLSKSRNAFRPFWRTDRWNNAPAEKQFYWYPGDTVTMAVIVAGPGRLRLVVADAGPQPKRAFQVEFEAKGFAPRVPRQFKRVNAIDQRRNEGKPAQPTKAEVTGAVWTETYLLRGEGAAAERLPMTPPRFTGMRCPSNAHVRATAQDAERARGAERIDIHGTPAAAGRQ